MTQSQSALSWTSCATMGPSVFQWFKPVTESKIVWMEVMKMKGFAVSMKNSEVHRCSYTFIWLYFIFTCILNHKCFSHPCCLCLISSEKEHCGSQFFTCANYQCIPFGKHCDRTLDCLDGSDEKDCGCDKDLEFQCQNKQCINKKYRCDMEGDCDDNSDEVGCSEFLLCENVNLYFSQFFSLVISWVFWNALWTIMSMVSPTWESSNQCYNMPKCCHIL